MLDEAWVGEGKASVRALEKALEKIGQVIAGKRNLVMGAIGVSKEATETVTA